MPTDAKKLPSNISRAAAILSLFDGLNTPLQTRHILDALSLGRATGFALLRAMVREGWLERVDHGVLRLGPKATEWAFTPIDSRYARSQQNDPSKVVMPFNAMTDDVAIGRDVWDPRLVDVFETDRFRRTAPFHLGFANASRSNHWRRALIESVRYAHRTFGDQITSLRIEDANDDLAVQLEQVNAMVRDGIDLLLISATTTGDARLSDRLAELAHDGLPIVAVDRRPRDASCLVSFVTASDWTIGHVSALWLAEHLGGRGRLWLLSGLEGTSPAIRRQSAALETFSEFPGITVEAVTYTGWTEEGGHEAAARLSAQTSRPPDGVWCDSGLQGVGSLRYFLEKGPAVPAHTGGDLNRMYKLALHHHLPMAAVDYPAAMGARGLETAMDILNGRPVPRRIEIPTQVVLPRGMETRSVKADLWAELHVRWDLPDDAVLSQGPSLRRRDATEIERGQPDA